VLPDRYRQRADVLLAAADVVDGKMCTAESPPFCRIRLQSVGARAVGYGPEAIRHTTLRRAAGGAKPTDGIYLSGCRRHTDAVAGCTTGSNLLRQPV